MAKEKERWCDLIERSKNSRLELGDSIGVTRKEDLT